MVQFIKNSSQWQSSEFRKLNNSSHELFIFKILLTGQLETVYLPSRMMKKQLSYIYLKCKVWTV